MSLAMDGEESRYLPLLMAANVGFTLTFWLAVSSLQAKMCPERLASPPMQPHWAAGAAICGAEWPSTRPSEAVVRAAGKTCCLPLLRV